MFLQRECLSPFSQNGRIRKPKRREKGNKRSIYNETQKNPLFTKTNVYEEIFPSHALGLRILRSRCAGDDFGNERHGDRRRRTAARRRHGHRRAHPFRHAVRRRERQERRLQPARTAHGRSLHGDLLVRGLPERRIPGTDAVAGPDPQARRFPQGQPAARSRGHHGRRQEQFDERQPRRGGHQHLQRADRTDAYGQPQHERHHAPHAAGLVDHLGTGHRRRQLPPVVRDGRRRGVQQHVRHRRQPARRRFAHFARRAGAGVGVDNPLRRAPERIHGRSDQRRHQVGNQRPEGLGLPLLQERPAPGRQVRRRQTVAERDAEQHARIQRRRPDRQEQALRVRQLRARVEHHAGQLPAGPHERKPGFRQSPAIQPPDDRETRRDEPVPDRQLRLQPRRLPELFGEDARLQAHGTRGLEHQPQPRAERAVQPDAEQVFVGPVVVHFAAQRRQSVRQGRLRPHLGLRHVFRGIRATIRSRTSRRWPPNSTPASWTAA